MRTFRDFMESSLYAPGRGYYRTRTPTEDFYTAPELHPAFAGIVAAEVAARLKRLKAREVPEPYFIVEMGSGTGLLGRQLLRFLRERHPDQAAGAGYVLVERCEDNLVASVLRNAKDGAKVLGYTRLADVPPCPGVFLSNELVDAFPVHLLEKRAGRIREVYVREDGTQEPGELSTPELAPYAQAMAADLPEGGRHAVNLEAPRWLRQVSRTMTAGTLITVDYGKRFGPQTPNPPRSYHRHATGAAALTLRAGRQDLTASVDFEALIDEGGRCGLRLESYAPMGRFLLDRGILDWLPATQDAFDLDAYKARNRVKTLFHPEGMGETFKVLIQSKFAL